MNTETVKWKHYRIFPLYESIFIGISVFAAIFLTTYFIYHYALNAQKGEIKEGLLRTAKVVSTFIDGDSHLDFKKGGENSQEYKEAIKPLEAALMADDSIEYLYTAIMKDNKVYFILDATPAGDADGNGVEDKAYIMGEYSEASDEIIKALKEQTVVISEQPYTDRWGSFLSGYIPLYNSDKEFVGVLGIDIEASEYFARLAPIKRATFRTMVSGFFIAFLVASLVWFTRNFGLKINQKRKALAEQLEQANKASE